jgi:hypothetical protein
MDDSMPMGEFEPVKDKSPTSPGNEPTDEEQKLVRTVNKIFEKNKKYRKNYDENWLDYYKMFRGVQWLTARPSFRHSEVFNLIFQHIQGSVPIITDTRPKVQYLPRDPSDLQWAELINKVYEADWDSHGWLFKTTEVIYDSHIYGIGYSSMKYDPDANFGAGQIVYKSEDPFHCFPDEDSEDVNELSESFIYAKPLDIHKAKRDYPKKAEMIKPDMVDVVGASKHNLGEIRFRSPINTKTNVDTFGTVSDYGEENEKCLCIEAYLKPGDIVEEAMEQEYGNKKYVQKLKYPNGRYIKVCGGVPVADETPLPYDDCKFPFSRLVNYILPREFYGISEVEPLKSPQQVFNKLVSFVLDVLTIMGNPVWIMDTSSGIDPETVFNRPGLILEKEPGSEVRREEGVQLQPYVMSIIDRVKTWFDQLGGTTDVTRGVQPGAVTASSAIENLLDAAQTRLRQKMRNLDAYLITVGQQYLSRVLQFYTAPRVFRLTNDDGSMTFFKFHVEHGEDGKHAVYSSYSQSEDGSMMENAPERVPIKGELDVKVATGTGLPFAKMDKEQRLLQYFDRGIIDDQEVLEQSDYPNAEKVLERVARKKQEAAMMQQNQGTAPA